MICQINARCEEAISINRSIILVIESTNRRSRAGRRAA